ncbi:MAG: hypothetical protein WDO56_32040 [Gammaproteobacteria bacterium]
MGQHVLRAENLAPDSLGMEMYLAADRGRAYTGGGEAEVGILLSAAADTTVLTMANAIRAFCEFPDQYQLSPGGSDALACGVR